MADKITMNQLLVLRDSISVLETRSAADRKRMDRFEKTLDQMNNDIAQRIPVGTPATDVSPQYVVVVMGDRMDIRTIGPFGSPELAYRWAMGCRNQCCVTVLTPK